MTEILKDILKIALGDEELYYNEEFPRIKNPYVYDKNGVERIKNLISPSSPSMPEEMKK
jgi:hypothetical protein